MQIIWEGKDKIKIVSEKNTIVINADKKQDATVSINPVNEKDFTGSFLINNPGEYEINDDFFYVDLFTSKESGKKSLVYKLNIENINIVDLNNIDSNLEVKTSEGGEVNYDNIIGGNIDILLLPIGEGFLPVKEAIAIKNQLAPKIVIPMNYDINSEADKKKFEEFKSGFLSISDSQDKYKIVKKNLPQTEETSLVILNSSK